VSEPLAAQTLSGQWSLVAACWQTNANSNASLQLVLRVLSNDGTVERGVLYSGHAVATNATPGAIGEEFVNGAASDASRLFTVTATPLTILDGDRLVAEIGARLEPATTASHVGEIDLGDDGTDWPWIADVTETRTEDPWLGSSQAITFQGASSPQTVSPTAISSGETFGTLAITTGPVTVSPSGISSGEAFGTTQLNQAISPTGIASAEALGTPVIAQGQLVQPTGIPSGETFGAVVIVAAQTVSPSGIGTAEALGTPTTAGPVGPTGIAGAEAFGTLTINQGLSVAPTGIGTTEAVGTPSVYETPIPQPRGIPTAEVFGTPTIVQQQFIRPEPIQSAEQVQRVTVRQQRFIFTPPFELEKPKPRHWDEFTEAMDRQQGITVYRVSGVWLSGRNLSDDQLSAADLIYHGGYEHDIPLSTKTELEGAGYTVQTVIT
jgi:hypothetical protein